MKNERFETSDFGLVIYLSLTFPIIEIARSIDSKRALFIFEKTPELIQEIDNYWHGDAKVNPQKYHLQSKIIKSRLYENA